MRVYISGPITGVDDYVAIFQSYVSLLHSKGQKECVMRCPFCTLTLPVPTTIEGLLDTIDSMLEACFSMPETMARIWPDDEDMQSRARVLARNYYAARREDNTTMMDIIGEQYTKDIVNS